jgi:hypothetical protein
MTPQRHKPLFMRLPGHFRERHILFCGVIKRPAEPLLMRVVALWRHFAPLEEEDRKTRARKACAGSLTGGR